LIEGACVVDEELRPPQRIVEDEWIKIDGIKS
jgi:hypothetical protein